MKKLFSIIACVAIVFAYAQKKPNVNKAKVAFDKGDYAFAKSEIDRASEDEKNSTKAKTWFYRGMIYMGIDTAGIEKGSPEIVLNSFNKALELDPEQKQTVNYPGFAYNLQALESGYGYIDYAKNYYYSHYYNKGLSSYNEEDYASAGPSFETAYLLNSADSNSLSNAGYAYVLAEDFESAKRAFSKGSDIGIKDKNVYLQLYNFALKDEDYEEALNVVRRGKEIFPTDSEFSKYEIGLLIQLDKLEDAKQQAIESIENDPSNPDLYFSYASILEEEAVVLSNKLKEEGLSEEDSREIAKEAEILEKKAEDNYRNAIEIDSDHFNSNFSLGVLIFNKSQGMISERNALSYKEQKKFDELSEMINEQLNKALPIWEKIYDIDSQDETVLETLSYIYNTLLK